MSNVTRMMGSNAPGKANVLGMLHDVTEAVKSGELDVDKMLILYVEEDDDPDDYRNGFNNAGFRATEMIALMEATKHSLLNLMFED